MQANKSCRTNRPEAPQFHFNIPSTAPVGAHLTLADKNNEKPTCSKVREAKACDYLRRQYGVCEWQNARWQLRG
jgi:hypothetical protein